MSGDVKALLILEKSPLRKALEQLNTCVSGTLFCVDEDGRMIGVLTDGDVRRTLLAGLALNEGLVGDAMNRDFFSIREDEINDEALAAVDPKVKYLPVLDGQGRPVDYFLFDLRMTIPAAKPLLNGNEGKYVAECIATSWISSQGRFVKRFEKDFAAFCGAAEGVSTSNGTTALHLALAAMGIGPGDEVVVPSLTFIATVNAVTYTGATPVLVDSDLETWGMDAGSFEAAVTPRTKAVIPVHIYGQPAEMDPIMAVAERHGLTVVEDAAEAHGALYKGRTVGSIGHVACFSFFGNKILTTGEGGMVVTSDPEIARMARILRDHGMDPERKYWHPYVGFNYRMTNLQAAVGCAQLERIDAILAAKRRIQEWYLERLADCEALIFPQGNDWSQSVYWMVSVLVDESRCGVSRDEMLKALNSRNIEGRPFFTPAHVMPPYKSDRSLPGAEYLGSCGLNLPSFGGLTENEVDRVCRVVRDILAGRCGS